MKKLCKFLSFLSAFLLIKRFYYSHSRNKKNYLFQKNKETISFISTPIRLKTKQNFLKNNIFNLFFLGIFILFIFSGIQKYSSYLKSNIFTKKNIEFNGTEFPIKKVPNWVSLSDAERKLPYEKIPSHKIIPIPEYKISDFQEGKIWKSNNETQRNAYITYPVPNLGNYMLDGKENVGSHTGIDVKVPIGTPVYSFANGIVEKVENQKTGFGKFILLSHPNTPNPNNSQEKITIYSTYAHLSQQLVQEGDIVKKNQLIGKSGNSGMTTAPHLHFQVEAEDAPFHPYWPFTWNELNSSGISSYFKAINSGFNKSEAKKYTFHPIELGKFSKKYMASSIVQKKQNIEKKELNDPPIIKKETNNVAVLKIEDPLPVVAETPTTFSEVKMVPKTPPNPHSKKEFSILTDRTFIPGKDKKIKIQASEEILLASSDIDLSSTLNYALKITPDSLSKNDFDSNGLAEVSINTKEDKIFKIIAKTKFEEISSKSLIPQAFIDVPKNHKEIEAITYLKNSGIIKGYEDQTFRPLNNLTRSEAVKIILKANNSPLLPYSPYFSDVHENDWYDQYVTTAFKKNILIGYPDKTFGPHKKISKAEFLKIALIAAKIEISDSKIISYPDVPLDSWFSKYFQFSKEKNLLLPKKDKNIGPHEPITRSEAARIIWLLRKH